MPILVRAWVLASVARSDGLVLGLGEAAGTSVLQRPGGSVLESRSVLLL